MAQRKKQSERMVIKASDIKVPLGHQSHIAGTGAHRNERKDKKARRQRDRAACRLD
jgi:hypothetical protein